MRIKMAYDITASDNKNEIQDTADAIVTKIQNEVQSLV